MGSLLKYLVDNPSKSGESISPTFHRWINSTQKGLKKAFPAAEQEFARTIGRLQHRMPNKWKRTLWYTRQKWFIVDRNTVFFGDFYFRNLRLLVEIDGSSHLGKDTQEKDLAITKLIELFRQTQVLRLTNDEVTSGNWDAVEAKFMEAVESLKTKTSWKLANDYKRLKNNIS